MSWDLINKHREEARKRQFDILIWGPSSEEKNLFQIRLALKDYLSSLGHSAKFSEELIKEGLQKVAPNYLHDEIFQADAADIIIVLYKTRGTQTEFDRILKYTRLMNKCLIFMEQSAWRIIQTSISAHVWKDCESKVIKVNDFHFESIKMNVYEHIEQLQFNLYVRQLECEWIGE